MSRCLVLAALVLGACAPEASPSSGEPHLTSLSGLDPWVRVKCDDPTCGRAVLSTDAVSSGTITWFHPDGTTSTGTSINVLTPPPDTPDVYEVEVAYDSGDLGRATVAVASTRKRMVDETGGEATSSTRLIVAEVQGNACGIVSISSIGGCFDGTTPFTFDLWDGLADVTSPAPFDTLTPLVPATFDPAAVEVVHAGDAAAVRAMDITGAVHQDPPGPVVLPIQYSPPHMTVQLDQGAYPQLTVVPHGSIGTTLWSFEEAFTFECTGSGVLASTNTISVPFTP